jgi:hypothetical protein
MNLEIVFPFLKEERDDRINRELNLLRSLLGIMEKSEGK